jgi:glycosyltransferase involved in cell wall biosynthesis
MKKILTVTNICARGGAENQIFLLLLELAKLKVYDLSIAFFEVRDQSLAENIRQAGIAVYDLQAPRKLSLKPLQNLRKLIRNHDFDLVHSHLLYPDWVVAHIHKRYPKLKLIHTIHNCESVFKFLPVQWFYRLLVNREFSWSVCISKAVHDQVTQFLKIPTSRSNVIYYGYPAAEVIPQFDRSPRVGIELLFLARLVPQKNHVFLFKALAELRDQAIKVIIAGGGRRSFENYLRSVTIKLKINHMVEFVGQVANPMPLIQSCDALVLTSKWEGFGLVLLEAMSCAKPVIATDIAPINEVVVSGETGWLVRQDDVAELRNVLMRILQDQKALNLMGQNGFKRVTQAFQVSKMVQAYGGIYGSMG